MTEHQPMTDEPIMTGNIAALLEAFAKAQAEMGPAIKGAANSHFKSKYADIGSVLEAALPALNRHGLSLMQPPGWCDGKYANTWTILGHKDGGLIQVRSRIPLGRGTGPQGMGSALTYLRRYAAQGICSIPAVDDDGNFAQKHYKVAPPKPKAPAPPPAPKGDWHETWPDRHEAFLASADKLVIPDEGKTLMDTLKRLANTHGFNKTPAQMDEKEAELFLEGLLFANSTEEGYG